MEAAAGRVCGAAALIPVLSERAIAATAWVGGSAAGSRLFLGAVDAQFHAVGGIAHLLLGGEVSATVTSAAESIILEGTTTRKLPNSARSTLMPNCMASHTTLERLMRAFFTSPSDSEVSRTMRSMSILFVKYCWLLGWA